MSVMSLQDMPNEILLNILSNLIITDLIRCERLCKRIKAITSDEIMRRQKLSLDGINLNSNIINKLILHNGKSLTVLDLRNCKGLSVYGVNPGVTPYKNLIKYCDELKELNLTSTNLCRDSLNFLANNLTPSIVKLSLQNLKYLHDKHVSVIVKRCSQIRTFDLCHTGKAINRSMFYLNANII